MFDVCECACVFVHVGVWGLFMFLFQHMIYSVCLLGSLCESKLVCLQSDSVLENKLLCAEN